MRRRIVFGHVVGLAACFGAGGCASAPAPRAEPPPQFRLWKPPAGTSSSSATSDPFAKSPVTASIPRYRPGSILLRRFRRPAQSVPPAMTGSESKDALARFFPGLYGAAQGEPTRLAKARRPIGGESTRAGRDEVDSPVLATGLRVQAYPKPPSPSLPASEEVAHRDPQSETPASDPGSRLVSNETPVVPGPPTTPDLIDSLDLGDNAPPAHAEVSDAPVDAASRPTTATVETPEPIVETVVSGPPIKTEVAFDPMPPASVTPAGHETPVVEPRPIARVESSRSRHAAVDPVLAGRPRMSSIDPMNLPEPVFPPTYHGASLNSVLRQESRPVPTADRRRSEVVEPKPARRSMIREFIANRLHPATTKPSEEKTGDREVRPSSGTGESSPSGRLESREAPQRWKIFQGVPSQRSDESS